jgi:hypothetical protein
MIGLTVWSGGQTGVDRAALDAAMALGVLCGGWCPAGRLAEDGPIPDRYPVRELASKRYSTRTLRNVTESNGTLIVFFGQIQGGTELTLKACLARHKPYRLLDAREMSPDRGADLAREFIASNRIGVLNVAGPRASQWPGGYDYVLRMMVRLLNA